MRWRRPQRPHADSVVRRIRRIPGNVTPRRFYLGGSDERILAQIDYLVTDPRGRAPGSSHFVAVQHPALNGIAATYEVLDAAFEPTQDAATLFAVLHHGARARWIDCAPGGNGFLLAGLVWSDAEYLLDNLTSRADIRTAAEYLECPVTDY